MVSNDDIVLDCYRLAKHYGVDPDIFMNKPLSVIRRHRHWTAKLIQAQQPDEDPNG